MHLSVDSPTLVLAGRKFYREIPQPLIPPLTLHGGVDTQHTQQLKEGLTQRKACARNTSNNLREEALFYPHFRGVETET